MIRCRFTVKHKDFRPLHWPIKHPYWCTGYDSDDWPIVVAYADDEAGILENWPEAEDLDSEDADDYFFSDRFPKPYWWSDDN